MITLIGQQEANKEYFGMKLPRPGQGCRADNLISNSRNPTSDNIHCPVPDLCLARWCKLYRREHQQNSN